MKLFEAIGTVRLFFERWIVPYDFDPAQLETRLREPQERWFRHLAIVAALAFFVLGTSFILAGWIDNKPTTASTGLVGIHKKITLSPQTWFTEGIWWYKQQTPTPLPFTAIGLLFMVAGYSPAAVMILHTTFGALCGYLFFRVCQNRFRAPAALLALLLLFHFPLFLWVSFSGWTFIWATAALMLCIVLLDRYHCSRRIGWYLLAALALGAAGMSRPENYAIGLIVIVFVGAPLRYRPLFLLIVFTYPLLQYLHNNIYLDAPPGLRILQDARAQMTYAQILSEWAQNVYSGVARKTASTLFLIVGVIGVVFFGVPRRRFLTAILLYFIVMLAAAYTMRRLSFNHEGYYFAPLVLLIPFIAQTLWQFASTLTSTARRAGLPHLASIALLGTALLLPIAWNVYDQRHWLRSRAFYQVDPDVKAARDFIKQNASPVDPIALDYIAELTWLIGELESDEGRDIWFYNINSSPRPRVNAGRRDAPAEDIAAMNEWVSFGFAEWALEHPPRFAVVPSDAEWQEGIGRSKTATQYKMFGLRSAFAQPDLTGITLDADGSLLRGRAVFENERMLVYETHLSRASVRTLTQTDFRDWTESVPLPWRAIPPESVRVNVAEDGGASVVLNPLPDQPSYITRRIQSAAIQPGRLLELEATLNATDTQKVLIVMAFEIQSSGGAQTFKQEHPGDGTWTTLRLRSAVPENATLGFCYISCVLREGATAPASVRNVAVRVLTESSELAR